MCLLLGMHSYRIRRYLVLGLLVHVFQGAFCRTSTTCGSRYDDVASSSVLASVVFEGTASAVESINDQRGGVDNLLYNLVQFKVRRVFKGDLPRRPNNQNRFASVLVGKFGGVEDLKKCIAGLPTIGQQYVVFLNSSERTTGVASPSWQRPETTEWSAAAPLHYPLSAIPVASSKSVLRQVRDFTCKGCAKQPKARLTKNKLTLTVGQRLQLHCKVQGKPLPVVQWFMDGTPIPSDDSHYVSSRTKRGSRLRVRKAKQKDAGQFSCQALSASGTSDLANARVSIVPDLKSPKFDSIVDEGNLIDAAPKTPRSRGGGGGEMPPPYRASSSFSREVGTQNGHQTLCKTQTYCLNGGVCYQMASLGERYCECKDSYVGPRCEEKQPDSSVTDAIRPVGKRDSHSEDRTRTITGLVIGAVILALIFIVSYMLAKRKKTEFHKRRATKRAQKARATNGSVQPLLQEPTGAKTLHAEEPLMNPGVDICVQTEELLLTPSPSDDSSLPSYRRPPPPLPRQNTAPSRLQVSDASGRARLHGVSITPDLPMCRANNPNVAVVSAIVEPEREAEPQSPPDELDKLSEFSDLEVNMESEADVTGLDDDDLGRRSMEPLTSSTSSEGASSTSDSSIGEEIALFQQLARNPRVPSTPSHTSQNSLTWPSEFASPHSPIMSAPRQPPPPYIHSNGVTTKPRSVVDDFEPRAEFAYPYDPDPDATVV